MSSLLGRTTSDSLHTARVEREAAAIRAQTQPQHLKYLGASGYDLLLPETHVLSDVIQPDEAILGIVYGRFVYDKFGNSIVSRGALVATTKRILLLDKKPLFVSCEELSYDSVRGLSYSCVGAIQHICLQTRNGDVNLRTFNRKCARSLTSAIERALFNLKKGEAL